MAGSPFSHPLAEIQAAFERDAARAAMPTPPDLLAHLKDAQREKVANKTRELECERRVEVRKARLITRRSVGEVGYVGQVKRALGLQNTFRGEVGELVRGKLGKGVAEGGGMGKPCLNGQRRIVLWERRMRR
jgi:hypothetical protein